jgi:hypothetical protein
MADQSVTVKGVAGIFKLLTPYKICDTLKNVPSAGAEDYIFVKRFGLIRYSGCIVLIGFTSN